MVQQESRFFQVMMQKECIFKLYSSSSSCKRSGRTSSTVQENAEDIYAEAVEINEERAAKKECFEDEAEDFEEVDDEAESADAEAAAEAE